MTLEELTPEEMEKAIEELFNAKVVGEIPDAEEIRRQLIAELDKRIEALRECDLFAQRFSMWRNGVLGTGAMTIRGFFDVFDRPAAVFYDWKEQVEQMSDDELLS